MATMTNMFDMEAMIVDRLSTLVDKSMILVEANVEELTNEFFIEKDTDAERVGLLVLHSGYRTDPLVGNNRSPSQQLKILWQVVVVCPKDLYKSHGGVKMVEVMQLLKGWRAAPEMGIMQLVDDERGFNRPDYANDLAYLPSMFSVQTII